LNGPAQVIGIDARAAADVPAGRGRVVRELLRELAARGSDDRRYVLYTRRIWDDVALDDRFRWQVLEDRDPLWHVRAARLANRECDVFLATNSYLTTWLLTVPAVPIVYDLVTFERSMRPNRRSTVIERVTLGPAVRRSARLVAISQSTADALVARFPKAAGRVVVAPLGPAPSPEEPLGAEEARALPPAGFVLAVGTLEPRKNLPRLVDAFRGLPEELQRAHPLVAVGALGWETGPTLSALRSLGERGVILGHVSDAALQALYERCSAFCYPSLGEGFGLPVLEAMAAGAPVVTSNVSSLPEVGGDAVEYANPYDTEAIRAGLERLLTDAARSAELRAAGPERARAFSWSSFADRVLEALQEAASTRS
jgi:alpha-1,3-rhamnosyl/mannosyltransferase